MKFPVVLLFIVIVQVATFPTNGTALLQVVVFVRSGVGVTFVLTSAVIAGVELPAI